MLYVIYCKFQSSTELLALPDYYTIIRTIFEQHPREKLKCPNEMCLRKFTNTQSLISHAQQCAVAKARSTQIDKSTASSRSHRKREPPKRYEHYKEYKGCASSWAVLSSVEKLALIKDALERSATKRIACLNPECLLKLRDANEVLEHVNQCYLPEYFHYLVKF
ncbi:unnamed protein product [Toxocara canis]|uniref:Uncharacterized protein n=1 Tax=Toxocara canis TaxID=6265 RepID=A0A3P7G305_TOXCA|nr:unnamed protein product [Toxocara canis]